MIKSTLIYFFTFLVSIFISSFYKKTNNKVIQKIIILLSIAPPIFIATIRYNVGIDFFGYYESYVKIQSKCQSLTGILEYYQEPLHVIINIIAYKLFNSYYGFLFIASFLVMIFTFKGILNFKRYISISLAYFIFLTTMYHVSFNGTRQVIAALIIFYAYKYIINRDLKKYIIFVIIAGLFHKSAYICMFLYWVWYDEGKNENKYYLKLMIFTIAIPIMTKIIYYLCIKFNIYVKYFSKYEVITTYGFILYIIPMLVIIYLNRKNLSKDNKSLQKFFTRIYMLQIPLQLIGNYIPYADRLSLYAMPAQIILLPIFLSRLLVNKKINKLLIISWYILYYIIMFILLKSNGVYPYQTVFDIM